MTVLRARNAAFLAKIEASEGIDAAPSAGSDAVLVENLRLSFDQNAIQTNEATGSLDPRAPIPGGLKAKIAFDTWMKGSGSPGTPPEFGKLFKACGWKETITAAAVPLSPEAATAGSANTATFAAPFSATSQAYRGMPMILDDNPAAGAVPFVVDWSGGRVATFTDAFNPALDGTTVGQIPINVLYGPTSDASLIASLTQYLFMDGLLYKILGARGSVKIAGQAGGAWKASWDFTGMFAAKIDAGVPACTYQSVRPPIWTGGAMLLDRKPVNVAALNVDTGIELANPENPAAAEGFDPAVIVGRKMTGSIDPLAALVASRDALADFRAGAQRIVHARVGSVPGNSFGVVVPAAQYTGFTPGERSGMMTEELPFACVGEDAGAFIAFH